MNNNDGLQKKRIAITTTMAIISFAITVVIGFWTSPFIVSKLGSEAYGFSSLGGNITTYMSLITVAVNSFAARYISIEMQRGHLEQANRYFTSVFYTNLAMCGIMLIPMSAIIIFINSFFDINPNLITEVRIQWIILFAAWLIDLLFQVFTTATFVKNRLDINHGITVISSILRLTVILILFLGFAPHLWFIGFATIVCNIFCCISFFISKHKIMPEVRVARKYFDISCIKTLTLKGMWSSFNSLASILMNGFDLVITNLVISGAEMGFYSIAQTIPTYLQGLMYTLCNVFTPNLTISYARGRIDQVRDGLKFAMKQNGLLLLVPLLGFFVCGQDFYKLWQYSLSDETITKINILSILVVLPMISSIFVQPLLTANSITARLKMPVFINALMGILNIVIEIPLAKYTPLGIYAIAGVSSILLLLRNYLFYPMYSAHILELPKTVFYSDIMKGTLTAVVVFVFLYITHSFFTINSWLSLILYAVVFGALAEVIVFMVLLNKNDRTNIINILKSKIRRKGNGQN